MKPINLAVSLAVVGFASTALFASPAVSAPISGFAKDVVDVVSGDDSPIIQIRNGRGGRGGVHRGAAVRGGAVYRGGAAYRGGAVVRRGAVVSGGGGAYAAGYCDPNYQYCGGAYRGAVVSGGTVARGGAVARGGGGRGAYVAHRGGGRRR
jgi:hypothetical protein